MHLNYRGPVSCFSILNSPQGALLEAAAVAENSLAETFTIYEMAGGILCPQAKA